MSRRNLPAVMVVSLVAGAASLSAQPPTSEVGTIRGRVAVVTKSLFGGTSEAKDRSGAVVYLSGFQRPAPSEVAVLEQINQKFRPRVLPIVAGQRVSFPNHDPIYHNVFSVSPLHSFDLGQHTSSEPPASEVFQQPGLVPVYCNIHPDMIAYILVLENDAFSPTAADGSFEIRNVPTGHYHLNAWMPAAQRVTQEVEIVAGQVSNADLTLRQTEKIAPHTRKDGRQYPPKEDGNY